MHQKRIKRSSFYGYSIKGWDSESHTLKIKSVIMTQKHQSDCQKLVNIGANSDKQSMRSWLYQGKQPKFSALFFISFYCSLSEEITLIEGGRE